MTQSPSPLVNKLEKKPYKVDYVEDKLSKTQKSTANNSIVSCNSCTHQKNFQSGNGCHKSLHPACPSQIRFDFDDNGEYSSDGNN